MNQNVHVLTESRLPVIVLVGPTAVGKTSISLYLAGELGGEVISVDSRQFYRGMDIGTAKVSLEERRLIPHHLIDILEPDQMMSVGEFQSLAYETIAAIHSRRRVPLLVGGTGQYVKAVVEGWQIPNVPPQSQLRSELARVAEMEGEDALFEMLQEADPVSAGSIDRRNIRRVIRALEVTKVTGKPFSDWQRKSPPPFEFLWIGLTRPRPSLYARVDARIEQMIDSGFVNEVARLLAAGYDVDLPSFSSLGYREIAGFLRSDTDLNEARSLIARQTRQFIRRQYNWFKLTDPNIRWFDLDSQTAQQILVDVANWLGRSGWLSQDPSRHTI